LPPWAPCVRGLSPPDNPLKLVTGTPPLPEASSGVVRCIILIICIFIDNFETVIIITIITMDEYKLLAPQWLHFERTKPISLDSKQSAILQDNITAFGAVYKREERN
jgi:hypothetical protein